MHHDVDPVTDLYLSNQWRIHAGPNLAIAREELRDRFIPLVIQAFGSVEACLDLLLRESRYANGYAIKNLIHGCEVFCLRLRREAVEGQNQARAEQLAGLAREFHHLWKMERKLFEPVPSKNDRVRAMLRTAFCRLPAPVSEVVPMGTLQAEPIQAAASGKRRGPSPNDDRRQAIAIAIGRSGARWRDHLPEILAELDRSDISLGSFFGRTIDLGDGTETRVSRWEDLDLAQGHERRKIVDVLRKYEPRN
jgi:hypothetical protein